MAEGSQPPRNILFIMSDQLRHDYLGCAGHPVLETPNIDALAARGVRFARAYCQAPVCGGSRMSFYTGRYAASHGAHYNNYPLRVDEWTLADHLAPLGVRTVLVGKTHMAPDAAGMARLGIDPASPVGVQVSQCGFELWERDDGLHPEESTSPDFAYNRYLWSLGYEGENPWHEVANSARGPNGEVLSGWHMRHAPLPARVDRAHSETAWMTDRAIEFLEQAGPAPWCLHLSYIKPHWPYMAPAPYHALYRNRPLPPPVRSEREREHPHPVVGAFMRHPESECFSREPCREAVIPTYMGLVRELDDHLGRLFAALERLDLASRTLVVFTSDHGDYLGDHWLGEKDLFHEPVVRIPLIVADPDPAADATRGTVSRALVEAVDLAPTFLEWLGGEDPGQWLEGRSLVPLLRGGGEPAAWRDAAFSDSDYALRHARRTLGLPPHRARAFMVVTGRWKLVEYMGFRPQLFDLEGDPGELEDLGESPAHEGVRRELRERILEWLMGRRMRVTLSDREIERRTGSARARGYHFGLW